MGFAPVATHEVGEVRTASRRITMVLDLKARLPAAEAAQVLDLPLSYGNLGQRVAQLHERRERV